MALRARQVALAAVGLVALAFAPACALRVYDRKTVLPGSPVELSWSVSDTMASLGMVVSDAAVANGTQPWLGVGIGDPQSGGMLGADIGTAIFMANGSCSMQDRHVPSVGYPLGEADGGRAVFPSEDSCGTAAWKLVSCSVDKHVGKVTLEVDRALKAQDPSEDRDIDKEWNIVIVAWGDGFGYHGKNRISTEVNFTKSGPESVGGLSLAAAGRVPKDATANQMLPVTGFEIPERETTYMCKGFTIDRPASGGPRQVVAAEPVIDLSTPAGKMVHHFVLSSCETGGLFDKALQKPIICEEEQPRCRDIVYAWAKGQGPLVYPEVAGFPVADDERHYILQVHYDNPEGKKGVVDSSSAIRLHFTDQPRKLDAGTINIGDPFVSIAGQQVLDDYNYTIECPNACLSQLAQPVTVFQSFLHSHLSGKQMWTNMFRGGKFLKTLEATAFWSNDFQRNTLSEQTEIRPTDSLVIGANYDTRKRIAAGEKNVTWGLGTRNEMLMSFLFVYPRPKKSSGVGINYCGLLNSGEGGKEQNFTMCTDGVTFKNGTEVIVRDAFNLTVTDPGFSSAFGGTPQCQLSESTGDSASSNEPSAAGSPADDSDENEAECFPADSTVQLESGEHIPLHRLAVGNRVLVDVDTFSEVFMFTHKLADAVSVFTRIHTRAGVAITLTPGHYLPVAGKGLTACRDVVPGDVVRLASGGAAEVSSIENVSLRGLYNPQTLHGQIVVDGVVASTYTEAVIPPVAHVLLNPLRAVYRRFGWYTSALDSGAPDGAQAFLQVL